MARANLRAVGRAGGADADIIAGGVLLDFKAATTRRIVADPHCGSASSTHSPTPTTPTACETSVSARCAGARRWITDLDELVSQLAGEPWQ